MIQLFKKIEHKRLKQEFNINIQFFEDNFNLIVLEKNNAWKAKISRDNVSELAEQYEISQAEYFSKLRTYLVDTPDNVELRFSKSEFFCYCKSDNDLSLKYFSTKLHKIEFNKILYELLESYSSQNQLLKQQDDQANKQNEGLKKDKIKLETKLTELVDKKKQDEDELYSNFVLVLNEKKRRIQHLNQLLLAFKAGRSVINPPVKLKSRAKNEVKQELENVSESDSESGTEEYNSEEEKVQYRVQDILPSSSNKHNFDLFDEDSPVTTNLPKRKKVNNQNIEKFVDTPTTSNISSKMPKKEVNMEVEDNSPKIGFSTQDLLDCL